MRFRPHPTLALRLALALLGAGAAGAAETTPVPAPAFTQRQIWAEGPHNAFSDLIRWRDTWWCTFRESAAHVGGDGAIRVLRSADGQDWRPAARVTVPDLDLRDPKFSVTPDGRLMINCGASVYRGTRQLQGRTSRVLFSEDGEHWTEPRIVAGDGEWLWRVTWHEGTAYGIAYHSQLTSGPATAQAPTAEWRLHLYQSRDGLAWERITTLAVPDRPNEATVRFDEQGRMLALVRREAGDMMGWVGSSSPPFRDWTWQVSNLRLGGPNLLRLPDGRWIVGTRRLERTPAGKWEGAATLLGSLDRDGRITPLLTLPSGGDCSYPSLAWHEGRLWVSHYSSHEGRSSIYLAEVRL